jgi:diguanylate cyclase (GGDEF)-like protein
VALATLVIAGVHIVVAIPVLRLGKRLQKIESHQAPAGVFRPDLDSRPLDFVRRLEAAFDRLAQLSKTDELTGLGNRRHFNEVLERFYEQASRYGRPLSVMVMDVDYFKAVNDTGGHGAGDETLKVIAREIRDACRRADLPARLGGDEFAVLLPETTAHEAATVAERIREAVAANVTVLKSVEVRVTISIGVADLDCEQTDCAQDLMALADGAVYRAKELGRNRVVQAGRYGESAWRQKADEPNVNALRCKLAGLDTEFQTLFLTAVQEIIKTLERRDPYMADHARQVRRGGVLLARHMQLPPRTIRLIEVAATMHDIGMLAMPDAVLLCPHELDEQQTRLMRRHPLLAAKLMQGIQFFELGASIVRCHHERYDGQGYPEGLSGPAIPLPARILAVADAFVAMVSPRAFRAAKSAREALAELEAAAGSQFDPAVVNAFLELAEHLGDGLLRRITNDPAPHRCDDDLERPAVGVTR